MARLSIFGAVGPSIRRLAAVGVLIALPFNTVSAQGATAGVIAGGMVAKDIVEELDGSLAARISQAAASGEYLSQKLYGQVQMLLASADRILGDNIDATFANLTDQQKQFLRTVERVMQEVEETRGDVLDLEQFAAMDLATLAGLFPFVEDDAFLIRRIEGYSQPYRDSGSYAVTFSGRAFDPAHDVEVKVAGQTIAPQPFQQQYQYGVAISSHLLNPKFAEGEVVRVPLSLTADKVERPGFLARLFGKKAKRTRVLAYETDLLLLPKYPASYEFVQVHAGQGWSEKVHSVSNTTVAHPTGVSGKWNRYNVCVGIPGDALMIKDTVRAWVASGVGAGAWGHWEGGYQYHNKGDNGPRKVCRSFAHQIHDQQRTLAIRVGYRTPVTTHGRLPVRFTDPITQEPSQARLQVGHLYEARLDPKFITYYLRLTYFNGTRFTLQQGVAAHPDARLAEVNRDGYAAVTLLLENPYE